MFGQVLASVDLTVFDGPVAVLRHLIGGLTQAGCNYVIVSSLFRVVIAGSQVSPVVTNSVDCRIE